jgi:hypothetical protein
MSEEVGRLTPIDIAINKLITPSNKLKVTDGEQIRKILMDIKNYERLEIGRAHSTGFNRLWWDKEMNFQYYENEYGNIQCTKESRSVENSNTRNPDGTFRSVQSKDKKTTLHSGGLGGSESSTGNKEEGETFVNGRVRKLLLGE